MAVAGSELSNVRSSVVFEIFLTINRWCLLLWLLVESLSFVYKNATIIYPTIWVIINQCLSALLSHRWYCQHYGEMYPSKRCAIIPYIL
ncbi:unnamed protein product [Rotaria sp. Silwood1]|nr:unnamed protein product [Rotaria sp. Silwood1]